MNLNRCAKAQQGQILPLGLAFLFSACLGLFLLISLGRTLVARERHRMQVDLTAHAAAIDLARGLNAAACLNKAQAIVTAAAAIISTPYGAYLLHLRTSNIIDNGVKVANLLPEATVLYVGIQNDLIPLALWSHGIDGQPNPVPSLNLTRRYANSAIQEAATALLPKEFASAAPAPSEGLPQRKHYSYKRVQDGKVIDVDSAQVEKVTFRDRNGKLRTQSRKRDPLSGRVKFVKSEPVPDPFPLDLVETGPHRVTIIGRADNQELFNSRLLPRPPAQTVMASAEAGGGNVQLLALNPNADFDAYLIPVERGLALGSTLQKGINLMHTLRTFGLSFADDLSGWTLIAH